MMKTYQLGIFLTLLGLLAGQTILVPDSLTIVRGQCSNVTVFNTSTPIGTSIQISSNSSGQDVTTSRTIVTYNGQPENFSVCISNGSTLATFPLSYTVINNSTAVQLSTSGGTIFTVVNSTSGNAAPVVFNSATYSTRCAEFRVSTSGSGQIYYVIRETGNSAAGPSDFVTLKRVVYTPNGSYAGAIYTTIVSPNAASYQTGVVNATAGSNTVQISNLLDATNYTVCFYYETSMGTYSTATCSNGTTGTNGRMLRAQFQFNYQISPSQLNKLLCYLTSNSDVPQMDIITIDGFSCNGSDSASGPANYYYKYNGTTIRPTNDTVIYWASGCDEARNQNSQRVFTSLWGGGNTLTQDANNSMNSVGINYVKNARNLGERSVYDMMRRIGEDNNVITIKNATEYKDTFSITGIRSSNIGEGFFILVSNSSGNSSLNMPTNKQIMKCLDATNQSVQNCSRIIFSNTDYVLFDSYSDRYSTEFQRPVVRIPI